MKRLGALALFLALVASFIVGSTTASSAQVTTSPARLRMFSANVGHQVRLPQVRADIRTIKPDVVVLTEAYQACGSIRSIARALHYTVAHRACSLSADTVILVKRGFGIAKRGWLTMTRPWTGPHGGHQPAKSYPMLWLRSPQGQVWVVAGVHFPWVDLSRTTCGFRTRKNLAAWQESWRRVSSFIHRQQTRTVVAGDWNAERCQLQPRARKAGVTLVPGTKVDHAIVRHVTRATHHHYQEPNKIAHGWLGFTFTSPA